MKNLIRLPQPDVLQKRVRALAMLDALLVPEVHDRQFGYQACWHEDGELAFMNSPDYDKWFVMFSEEMVLIKGADYQHKVLEVELPPFDDPLVREFWSSPPCETMYTSFGFEYREGGWRSLVPPVEGSLSLLDPWFVGAGEYAQWLMQRHGYDVDPFSVAHLFDGKPVSPIWLTRYFPQSKWQQQPADWLQIDYPFVH